MHLIFFYSHKLSIMIRTTILKRTLIQPIRNYSILDSARHKLSDLNHKVGLAASHGIEKTEHTVNTIKSEVDYLAHEDLSKLNDQVTQQAKTEMKKGADELKETFNEAKEKVKENFD